MPPLPDRVIGLSPFERPDPGLVAALCRAGLPALLDLGADPLAARAALSELAATAPGPFGLRLPEGGGWTPADVPAAVDLVLLPPGADPAPWRPRTVLVRVCTLDQARAAAALDIDGLVLAGHETGGRVGPDSALVLLQQALPLGLPLWVQAGLGPHGAAACVAGGAHGVVLDDQLALAREATTPGALAEAISAMDGGETAVRDGVRTWLRPGRPELPAVPMGVGAGLAASLARRHRTAAGIVRAVGAAIDGHRAAAARLRPLAPGAPLARAWGLPYPVAQGPMTRVSDRAAFAQAVSDAGGLPFVALALSRGAQARPVLEETAARLAGRTWGVGILGFAPPDLREEQLALILELRPPVVLIAGGRPSQARPLEQAGIETWLHVPSPGLLDLFLHEGARRFVFEGREAGGHVGPRTSLSLWEAQVERLLQSEHVAEVSVLFAGGVHDARTAAMVATLAAPLAEAGARIGVLMGTAYVLTHEIVASGALGPVFQEEVRRCRGTALLESAPGHVTRCVDGPFARAFAEERARLEAAGRDPKEIWAALEQLNLGRLRLAAKGLRRDGAQLVEVGEEEQRRDGLFMIGQAAALRDDLRTIAELHTDVCEGGTALLGPDPGADQPATAEGLAPPPADIAIVGMACVFPEAPDLDSYWSHVLDGVSAIREVPPTRWSTAIYHDPDSHGGGLTYSKVGGWLPAIRFDPLSYGIPPRSLTAIEPIQLLALEVARRALADAGYAGRSFDRDRTAVVFGAEAGTELAGAYGFRTLYRQYVGELPPELDAVLPQYTEDTFPGVLANVISGRIANRLDLGGPNYTVDAACASSLAAVDAGVKELLSGSSDMAVVGGADLHNGINDYVLFCSTHALSRREECRVFDATADGTIIGEGVAAVVLKRLADARRDGDRIYAVIRGVGAASDGKSLGLTAPRKLGQVRALRRAYDQARVPPAEVGLVEAHGTGTVVGDKTELSALTEVFAEAAPGACALGSVKSQIGHTKCAAGLAGLIKAALAVHHGVRPPTLGVEQPNPFWQPQTSPFSLTSRSLPWASPRKAAGVSAFGFGGTNFHVVLSAADGQAGPAVARAEWPAELFLFRGVDRDAARVRMQALARLLDRGGPWRLRDLARSVNAETGGPVQVAIVARSPAELSTRLAGAMTFSPDPRGVLIRDPARPLLDHSGQLALLFPGQGSQRPGMLADLFVAFPHLHRFLHHGARWLDRLFPPDAHDEAARAAQQAAITDTRVAQPTLGIAGLAMAALLRRFGLRAGHLAGHSYGELVALAVAGALDEAELLELSEARADSILATAGEDPGTMAAVTATRDEVEALLADLPAVVVANHNGPQQVVIAGPTAEVGQAVERLVAEGLRARPIEVACGFHSPLVAGAEARFAAHLAAATVRRPQVQTWSNTTAAPHPDQPEAIRALLARHVVSPVRFVEQVEAMYAAGVRVFVEAGPGTVLTGMVGRILGDRPHLAVATDDGRSHGLHRLLLALGALAVQGVQLDADALFDGRGARRFDIEHPPTGLERSTDWLVDGHTARPVAGPLPEGAMVPVTTPVVRAGGATPATPEGDRERVMVEYLDTMRQLVDAQRQVMLGYLGAPAQVPAQVIEAELVPSPAPAALSVQGAVEAEEEVLSLQDLLLGIVSERTGYPLDMLELDLDLEADLSIDSIKRIEILGALGERIGLSSADTAERDAIVEQLAAVRTLRGIVGWLDARETAPAAAAAPAAAESPCEPEALPPGPTLTRYVVALEDAPPPEGDPADLHGRSVLVADDGHGVSAALAARLSALGATARVAGPDEQPRDGEDLVDLTALAGGERAARASKHLFEWAQAAAGDVPRRVLAATTGGGKLGAGLANGAATTAGGPAGLLRTVARERPELQVRAVDLDPHQDPDRLAAVLAAELVGAGQPGTAAEVEVGWHDGARLRPILRARPVTRDGSPALELGPDAVVLVTGGARGIAARACLALARRFSCRLELVGRSPLPGPEDDPELAEATDRPALRRLLAARGQHHGTRQIEAACDRILADREIRATLAGLEQAGAIVGYHAVDVRDRAAFGALIDALYAQHGRIDGVVHAAGVLEDKLLVHKAPESFDRVFDTKVQGARVIAEKLRPGASFVVFFASVSGTVGNKGQVDYAAANDALDKLARGLNGRLARRVVAIDWGPWGGGGMVGPELEREYARRGIGLIPPDEGAAAFLDELLHGDPADAQVVWMQGSPESLA